MITERSPVVLFMFFRGSDTLCVICIGQYVSSGTGIGVGEEKDVIQTFLVVCRVCWWVCIQFSRSVILHAWLHFLPACPPKTAILVFTSLCVVLAQTLAFRRCPRATFVLVFPSGH